MKHDDPKSLVLLALALAGPLGCRKAPPPAPPAVEPAPAPVAEPEAPGEPMPVQMVEQQLPNEVPAGYDPSGRYWVDSECMAWNDEGVFLGEVSESTCGDWTDRILARSEDGKRTVMSKGATITLEGPGISGTLPCDGCNDVVTLALDAPGSRLAVYREEADEVEVWSTSTRRRLATLPLSSKPISLQLAWPGVLYMLMVAPSERDDCEDLDEWTDDCVDEWEAEGYFDGDPVDFSLLTYGALDESPEEESLQAGDFYMYISAVTMDPAGRCLYVAEFNASMRDEYESRVDARPLAGECNWDYELAGEEFLEEDDYDYDDEDDVWRFADTEWLDGPRPRFLAMVSTADDEYDEGLHYAYYDLVIRELSAERRSWGQELETVDLPMEGTDDAWVEMTERELLGARAAGGEVRSVWKHCFELQTRQDDEMDETPDRGWCTSTAELPRRCEFLDLSPDASATLASCGRGETMTLVRGKKKTNLGVSDSAYWQWGQDWLVTHGGGSGVQLRSLSKPGKAKRLAADAAWVPTVLSAAVDRVVLYEDGKVRVVDATTGEDVAAMPTTLEVSKGSKRSLRAALSPSGQRLAFTNGAKIEVFDLVAGQPGKAWDAPDTGYLAWRQDETVVFSGSDGRKPTAAWDLDGGDQTSGLPDLKYSDLDPSWRWSLQTPNRVMRTVDGLELWFDGSGVMLDDGRFEGRPEALEGVMYRLGEDMLASPMVSAERVRSVMEREGLAADFFEGRPIEAEQVMVTPQQRDAMVAPAAVKSAARREAKPAKATG